MLQAVTCTSALDGLQSVYLVEVQQNISQERREVWSSIVSAHDIGDTSPTSPTLLVSIVSWLYKIIS